MTKTTSFVKLCWECFENDPIFSQEDLPLMSNVEDILVRHYNFNFECNFHTKTFSCSVLLFLESVCDAFSKESRCGSGQHIDKRGGGGFTIQVADWSLKIWKNSETCKYCFPRLIRVSYETTSSCPSVLWTSDQDRNPAVFSHGAFINNRALFPCQEPPVAMATWEATVTVADPVTVLMSGDEAPRISREEGLAHYYYFTKKVLPLSTLCLAIGWWREHSIQLEDKKYPKCRLFAPSQWMNGAIQVSDVVRF
ncbi:aminopeptidase O [Caerostris extrusa]|uniref:Aminopeptidase O n=1 Tax=Caerostris extrusa TaxID=172846 RepID=A0AAV4N096_CAEEX|nr:aminopeptidase O [Caerostris extrusa]